MQRGEITGYIDVAQVVLYAFWIFFAGLVFYLRREDRREGYPLENEVAGRLKRPDPILIPSPKQFLLSNGLVKTAPQTDMQPARNYSGHKREIWPGAPMEPDGDGLHDQIGPGSYVDRDDHHDRTWDDEKRIVPLRVAEHFVVHEDGPNPIGMTVFGADRKVAGIVSDLWIDRGESMVRYVEVELAGGGRRVLMPNTFCRTGRFTRTVKTEALLAHQFADIPGQKDPDSVTLYEEERIMAYFGAGTLYATADRQEPFL
ncbi:MULTISPECIES: photosynthetic reaction center subunit H [unclassified Methylobacterium]|uniref:photosynthetic reaction center subunit H n=1 Tax=unclassified Methylobacterium TaxID=2615210 RepID=UPI000701E8FB|nr:MULTISPECIES: photosynthetic reaction center subunit H [unclassified Methylobacterium]KQO58180.1 H subunit of photosynthetic reaction center complex [Methylobacterium sp. Leaf86]KQO97240.1 H subunit of photosynthetic reaction center complex [Methylobacterium sp. Leaf91]